MPCKWKKPFNGCSYSEDLEKAQLYQETRRLENTEAENEYHRIYNLLTMRKIRAKRSNAKKREDDADAKSGMQFLPMEPFKSRQKSKV